MRWSKQPKPIRPRGQWKNVKTLIGVWVGGTFLILSVTLAALYPVHSQLREMQAEEAEARKFMEQHQQVLSPEWEQPEKPTEGETAALREKVPVTPEPARLTTQLQQAVEDAGAQWIQLRMAETPAGLTPSKEKEESKPAEKEPELIPRTGKDSRLKPYWADLRVKGTEDQLLSLFGNLHGMKPIVSVQGWEYTSKQKKAGDIRIRLAWFVYDDPELKKTGQRPESAADSSS